MNAKYALALILALQVTTSLCEVPTPSQELVEKYEALKITFFKRLLNAYAKIQEAAAPLVDSERAQAIKTNVESVQTKPEFQAFIKVSKGVVEEAEPMIDQARTKLLAWYEAYLRPYVGEQLDDSIKNIKVVLDMVMPAE